MNSDDITHILMHILSNYRARFLVVFDSDNLSPLISIQSLVSCCYVSNIEPTGKGGSHWVAFFHSRPNRLEFLDSDGRKPCEFGFSFPKSLQIFHNPYQIQAFGPMSVGIYVSSFFMIGLTTIHCIQYVKNSQHFHTFIQLQLFLHLFIMDTKE